jgi:cell division protein FtsI (penicillin-binding protein 3)
MRRKRSIPPTNSDFASKKIFFRKEAAGIELRQGRLRTITLFSIVWVVALVTRLFWLQISECDRWQTSAVKQHFSSFKVASERGPVFDRNNRLLAVSVPAGSIYVRPGRVSGKNWSEAIRLLGEILELPYEAVERSFNKSAPFVWIKRQVPKVLAEKVEALGIEGIGYAVEPRRFYPYNEAGSALIGKVGIDGNGLSGIEAAFERHLQGEHVQTKVVRDALGKRIQSSIADAGGFRLPKGDALRLTVDARIQMIISEELQKGLSDTNAKSVVAVMLDAANGEILGMSQAPAVNFNVDLIKSRQDLSNRVVETVYEPGSTMKPIIAAAALEHGVVSADELIDCEKGYYRFGRHTINDVHPYEELSIHDVIVRSSNIGITKVGMRLGRQAIYDSLKSFGFGQDPQINIPGTTKGILRSPDDWAEVDVATHSFGQGIAVTPLQMARAIGAIANGGRLYDLKLLLDEPRAQSKQILSPETAALVRKMLFNVVEDEHGTGKRAAIKGVRIGGKTGTAQKAKEGARGYQQGVYIASFVGFAEASSLGIDRIPAMIVLVDEPDADSIYGGTLAAPIFQRIMERTLRILAMDEEIGHEQQGELAHPHYDNPDMMRVAYKY